MVGARRATIPESEAFRTWHEVPRVKKADVSSVSPSSEQIEELWVVVVYIRV